MAAFNPNFDERTADQSTIHSHKVDLKNLTGLFKHLPNYEVLLHKYLGDAADAFIQDYNENQELLRAVMDPEFMELIKDAAAELERKKNL